MFYGVRRVVVKYNDFASFHAALQIHTGEEARKPVIVVHRPAIERMVMALRTLNSRTEENLGQILGGLLGSQSFRGSVEVRRRRLQITATSRNKISDELIERPVSHHLIVDPIGIDPHGLRITTILRLI